DEQSENNVNRPNYKVDVYQVYKCLHTNVYGKNKASKPIMSPQLANDFCRIAIFCKDALDEQKFTIQLDFKYVCRMVCFAYDVRSASFDIPLKKCELLSLIGHLDDMLLVSKIHEAICSATREDQD
ncbi:hypothetical protein BCV72DRAFT_324563, partial [Rhizopus microsporus var. microsporus]